MLKLIHIIKILNILSKSKFIIKKSMKKYMRPYILICFILNISMTNSATICK